ncbi:hypothetical protein L2750_22425 [Shewanella submarina]|uniref:Uncharacterized protein n=1 Tax=Shewanella submarina TaxID=2016376 RepID=A0ABV7GFX2_9GAMM|nr:hypothetical protein [Shewanella submarina]MCL1039863.1 hypothetical protein [Shewanella submarina]
MFRSLFCLKGTDTRSRFLAICAACWALLLILPALFGISPLLLILAAPLCFVIFAASLRAGSKASVYGLVLTGLYLLAWVLMVFGVGSGALITAVVAAAPTVLIARQTLAVIKGTEQGYLAPGQSVPTSAGRRRREPVFGEAGDEYAEDFTVCADDAIEDEVDAVRRESTTQADPIAELKALFAANPRLLPGAAITVTAVIILTAAVALWPQGAEETQMDEITVQQPAEPAVARDEVKLPDGFSLGLVDGRLVMSWLGDKGEAGELWSLASAKGDQRCSVLKFNNGSEYRPVSVLMTADTVTEAWFSPLDARAVIQDVAMRGNAQLCGYKFSLKGTQSRLEAHRAFAPYL